MTKKNQSINKPGIVELVREFNGRRLLAEDLLKRIRAVRNSRGVKRAREITQLEQAILRMYPPGENGAIINKTFRDSCTDFMENWQNVYKELSENELLLCCLIRKGFSNADIAVLKGIDPRSVAVSRNRLKNKIGLETEQHLDEFIRSY